jgi:hypothetical protein
MRVRTEGANHGASALAVAPGSLIGLIILAVSSTRRTEFSDHVATTLRLEASPRSDAPAPLRRNERSGAEDELNEVAQVHGEDATGAFLETSVSWAARTAPRGTARTRRPHGERW